MLYLSSIIVVVHINFLDIVVIDIKDLGSPRTFRSHYSFNTFSTEIRARKIFMVLIYIYDMYNAP